MAVPARRGHPHSKSKGRSRRRFRELTGKQIRILILFALGVFVITIFKIGLPHASVRPPSIRISSPIGVNLTESHVDIKMTELYDVIEFKDIDGGAWKQGWDVQYQGDEWDENKLRVFVVPHSHNDPGWLRTVEEYYQERSRHIISTIVESLRKDKRRKFIWEEISYLERWWRDASQSQKTSFIQIVRNGQLEIVGGGWVMNDEANSHYYAIVEQITEGNLWLLNTVGVIPKNAWAIDPFGHSPTMAYLLKRMGFENMLIQRTHYEVKKILAQQRNLEFFWRQSWDAYNNTDIFCHMMPFYSYDIPHTCGPEPAICCQFDYWRLPGYGAAQRCPWGYDPQRISGDNVHERSEKLLDQYRKKSTLYRTNTLLVPLGDDFRYITIGEADIQFENYQKIFDYINSHPQFKAEIQFGTLEDYFTAAKAEMIVRKDKFPSLSGDFFTYADRVQDYWSGYYVSRPFYKSIDRVLEETLRAADVLFSFSLAYCQASDHSAFPLSFSEKLISARRNLALFQHHDGITGTAKNHVVVDYASRMHTAMLDLQMFMAQAAGVLLGESDALSGNAYVDFFTPEVERKTYDVLPVKKIVNVSMSELVQRVVIYNPLEKTISQVVMVLVESTDICVVDANWEPVESQVSPDWSIGNNSRHRLHWQAEIPPLGFQTFYFSSTKTLVCKVAMHALVKIFHVPDTFSCPSPYICSEIEEEMVTIQNQHFRLAFSVHSGQLLHLKELDDNNEISLKEDIALYSSHGSGAYLFKPIGEAKSIIQTGGSIIVTSGPLMQEVYTQPKSNWNPSPSSRKARLYNGKNSIQSNLVEMEYHVELLDDQYNDKELIVRYETGLETGNTYYSDLNGFQTIARVTRGNIPLQGNFYPMPSLAFLQGREGLRFSVHSRQALGVASLRSGVLEIMLDRRLTRDDDRGLGQGVLDNRPMDVTFHLTFERNTTLLSTSTSSTPHVPSLVSHQVSEQLNYPVHNFFGTLENALDARRSSLRKTFAPLASKFPCDVHLVTLKVPQPLEHMTSKATEYSLTLHRKGWDDSYYKKDQLQCTQVNAGELDLSRFFNHLTVWRAERSSLNLMHDSYINEAGVDGNIGRKQRMGFTRKQEIVSLLPMEMESLKLELVR